MSRPSARALVVLFLLITGLPLAANLVGVDGADAKAENRALAALPPVPDSWRSAAAFPAGLVAWFDDHFAFRARLVRWSGESLFVGLRTSPSTTVGRGADGWLFYLDDSGLDDYADVRPMSGSERQNWRRMVVAARDWVRARGGTYLFTVAPDKHVVYGDAFPAGVRRVSSTSRTDDLFAALDGTGVALDLRPALLAARSGERIYQKTDTHWNDRGAFVGYQQIVEAIRRVNPAVPPAWPRADFDAVEVAVPGMDLAGMIGLTRVLGETDLRLVPRHPRRARVVEPAGASPTDEVGRLVTEIPGSTLPRAVVFRDSFASRLAPFLSEHFSRVVYLWQNDFLAEDVEREGADVVIQEIVGRHLYGFIPSPELVPAPAHP